MKSDADQPTSPETAFRMVLSQTLHHLMDTVKFGAAAECFDGTCWEKRSGEPDNLYLRKGATPSKAVTQLRTYSEQRPGYEGRETAKLDCVEIIEVARWLTEIEMFGAKHFDDKYSGGEFVLAAPGSTGIRGQSLSVRSGDGGDDEYDSAGSALTGTITTIKGPRKGESIDLAGCLDALPAGSRVMWRNFDKYVPADDDFKNENTVKIGADSYAAHPLGTFSLTDMAQQVGTGGYEDMRESLKTATNELAELYANPSKKAGVQARISRRVKRIGYYQGVDDLAGYVARFIRIVEIETYALPT